MPHLDPDQLIMVAFGEQHLSATEAEHLDGCDVCADDLSVTRTIVGAGRDSRDLRDLPPPPEDLWGRIAAEAGIAPTLTQPRPTAPAPAPATRIKPPAAPRKRSWYALVAAIAAIVGVGVTVVVQQVRREDGPRIIAEADLSPQQAAPLGAHGTATIIDTGHGLQMRLDVAGMPATPGYYAVWLYDGASVMIPIGSPGAAPLNVPPTASDLARFHIVDVSLQDLGQQQHGVSMLQGNLGAR